MTRRSKASGEEGFVVLRVEVVFDFVLVGVMEEFSESLGSRAFICRFDSSRDDVWSDADRQHIGSPLEIEEFCHFFLEKKNVY